MYGEIKQRELKLTEVYSIGTSIFKNNIKKFVQLWLLMHVPLILLEVIATSHLSKIDIVQALLNSQSSGKNIKDMFTGGQMAMVIFTGLLLIFIAAVFNFTINMPFHDFTADLINEENISFKKSIFKSLKKIPTIIGVISIFVLLYVCLALIFILVSMFASAFFYISSILSNILYIVALVGFFAVPIYCIIMFYFWDSAVVLDDKNADSVLVFSGKLVRGYFLKTALYVVPIVVLQYILSNLPNFILTDIGIVFDFICSLFTAFFTSFFVCITTVLYINRKYMKYGFTATPEKNI